MGDSTLTGQLRRIPTEEGWREKLGLELGTDVQPADPLLTAIAALSMVADRYIYGTGADTVALGTITSFIRTLLDDADAAAARATLELAYATQAEQETATAVDKIVTPGRQHFHPSAAKFWAYVTVSGGTPTLVASYNVTSITDSGVGVLTVTIAADFSSANWAGWVTGQISGSSARIFFTSTKTTGSGLYVAIDFALAAQDPIWWEVGGFGDQ